MSRGVDELLTELRRLDVKVQVEGGRLRLNAPPGALTPELQGELRARRDEILSCLESATAGAAPVLPLEPVPRDGPLPLSFGQQRLWFLHQLEPDSPAYNIPAVIRHSGRLDPTIIERCLSEIVRRHEVLRSTLLNQDGQLSQVISPAVAVRVHVEDLSGLEAPARDARVAELIQEEARLPFDLGRGPLWRARLLRLAPEQHVFLFTMHHIVCDRWSLGLFVREFEVLQGAYLAGKESPLSELTVQYADFASWQRRWFQGEVLERQLSYWRKHLDGELPVLELPTDRPRPAMQTYHSSSRAVWISPALVQALGAVGQREGATLFMTVLAAFKVLLFRYSGQEDLIVGTPIANRNRVETERLIGFFINTLVLRTRFSGSDSFRQLLVRVKESAVGGYGHQDTPFEKLVEELQPERDLSRSPIFQVMFVLQNVPKKLDVAGIQTLSFSSSGASTYDLSLDLGHSEQGLAGFLDYNKDLFDEATITRMLGHFQKLLEGIVTNPDQAVSELPLLTEGERTLLLREWNPPVFEPSIAAGAHRLFENQAERTPDSIALELDSSRLTYRELNVQANRVAHRLRSLGVGEGTLVAVHLDRSIEMIVALLAILKAGGVYLPLDTASPRRRTAMLLEDAAPKVMITEEHWRSDLPASDASLLVLDTESHSIAQLSALDPGVSLGSSDLAYVIYTSGSTGRPKGVTVGHEALSRHILACLECFRIQPTDVVLQFSSLCFDPSLEQIFCALATGARLVIRGPDIWPVSSFLERIARHGVTVADIPTAYWQQCVGEWSESAQPPEMGTLRLMLVGGEVLTPEAAEAWQRLRIPRVRFLNAYGPTEATISATLHEIPRVEGEPVREWRVPIGRPMPGKVVRLLDRNGNLVPAGVPGELCIGGKTLSAGYLKQPQLTSERFVPDCFAEQPGGLLYRTGDLARYRHDGTIEFLGRNDDQVKIRGFRVELGEVESALRQHPGVSEALAMVREVVATDRRVVAYVVPSQASPATVVELKTFLAQRIPDYMMPAAIVLLDVFPLNASGKIDRQALPAPTIAAGASERVFVAPRDPLELQLARLWEQVLGRHPIGVRDNFFDVGGHSLLAVKLFSRIEKTLGKNLPLATLFQEPTIEGQANIFRNDGWTAPWSSLVPIQPGGSRLPMFVVHGVGGNVLFCRGLANYLGPDQPFYGIQSRGLDVNKDPHDRIEDMAAHYLKEIRNLQPEGPYLLGGFCMGGMVAFEMARMLQADGQKVGLVALLETHGPGYFLSPKNQVRFFYEERTLWQRIKANLHRLKAATPQERKALLQRKIGLVRNKVVVIVTGVASRIMLKMGHPTLAALKRTHHNNVQAQMRYAPGTIYPGRVHLFRASKQPIGNYTFDPHYGWGAWAETVEVVEFPGYHGTFMEEPYVSVFAERLRAGLMAAHGINLDAK